MNERLHELSRQALEQARVNACAKNKTDSPQNNTVWNEFPEVFAELIVNDMVNEISDIIYNGYMWPRERLTKIEKVLVKFKGD